MKAIPRATLTVSGMNYTPETEGTPDSDLEAGRQCAFVLDLEAGRHRLLDLDLEVG